jgi:hypothetical protein
LAVDRTDAVAFFAVDFAAALALAGAAFAFAGAAFALVVVAFLAGAAFAVDFFVAVMFTPFPTLV